MKISEIKRKGKQFLSSKIVIMKTLSFFCDSKFSQEYSSSMKN